MRRPAPVLLLLLLAALLPGSRCESPHRQFIRDADGRALILHGANVSTTAKGDPERLPWVAQPDVQRMADDWGFNFARYLILWDAIEPEPGVADDDYLDAVAERLDWFEAAGIHVVLDMHQDVYSRVFCCDGAPEWAIIHDGEPFQRQPLWWANYAEPRVMAAFDNFFDFAQLHEVPKGHVQSHFVDVWATVAQRFRDHPAVLGYDIWNEPFPGSAFDLANDPSGPMPAFVRDKLQPFYERVIAAIRAVDPDGWIFYEPTYGGPAAGQPAFLEPMQDPRAGGSRLAYFPHLYSVTIELTGKYLPNDVTVPAWARIRLEEIERLDAPLLIGEFGVVDSTENGLEHMRDVLDMADATTSGWAYWDYTPDTGFGFVNPDADRSEKPKVDVLVRTYPRAVAGRPLHYRYDVASRAFYLAWEETGVPGVTEVYVPAARTYPDGFEVASSDPAGRWSFTWDAAREVLEIRADASQPAHLIVVTPVAGP